MADSNIQNVALPEPKSRVVVPFSVAYGSDINKVKKILKISNKTTENKRFYLVNLTDNVNYNRNKWYY